MVRYHGTKATPTIVWIITIHPLSFNSHAHVRLPIILSQYEVE